MGQLVSSQINMALIEYLKSLQRSGQDTYEIDRYAKSFFLNGSPGSPLCQVFVKNFTIESPDQICFDESVAIAGDPIRMTTPQIKIDIGEAAFRCDDLGYIFNVSGKIQIFDVNIIAEIFPSFEEGLKINDVKPKVAVKKIKSDIKLTVNGSDHSRLANALLSTDVPELANTILNAVLTLQKTPIIDLLNSHMEKMNL